MTGLTAERLKAALHYDPETGVFTWLIRRGGRQRPDRIAGARTKGYVQLSVDGRKYWAHRVAWLYMTGRWPSPEVDHRDRVGTNNKWANLREATRRQNSVNMVRPNKSGFRGIACDKQLRSRPWKAQIKIAGRTRSLGLFATPEEAHAAYSTAARATYGEFAILECSHTEREIEAGKNIGRAIGRL